MDFSTVSSTTYIHTVVGWCCPILCTLAIALDYNIAISIVCLISLEPRHMFRKTKFLKTRDMSQKGTCGLKETYCSSIAVFISGSQRKTCVALTRLSPEECALAWRRKHSFCNTILALDLLYHEFLRAYTRVVDELLYPILSIDACEANSKLREGS